MFKQFFNTAEELSSYLVFINYGSRLFIKPVPNLIIKDPH